MVYYGNPDKAIDLIKHTIENVNYKEKYENERLYII